MIELLGGTVTQIANLTTSFMSNNYSKNIKLIKGRGATLCQYSTPGLTFTVAPTSTHISYWPAVAIGTLTTV